MTAFPEAYLVKEADMCPLNISLITDYDAGLVGDVPPVSHGEVIEVFNSNIDNLKKLLFTMIEKIPADNDKCDCRNTKKNSQLH
jgi:5'-methylthioadenosine phosphorylase